MEGVDQKQVQPSQPTKVLVTCPRCSKQTMCSIPPPIVINKKLVSLVIIEHKETVCQGCGVLLIPSIASPAGIAYQYIAVEPEAQITVHKTIPGLMQ